jgi:hypothetical protein
MVFLNISFLAGINYFLRVRSIFENHSNLPSLILGNLPLNQLGLAKNGY